MEAEEEREREAEEEASQEPAEEVKKTDIAKTQVEEEFDIVAPNALDCSIPLDQSS